MSVTLGYWKSRGLGQQIRLLLTYCGEKFDQNFYVAGPGPDFSREQWLSKKYNLGLDFPNLPYLMVGDFKLTQSTAILEYIADKNNLLPKSPEERATLLMINLVAMDIRNNFYGLTFGPDYEIPSIKKYMKSPDYIHRPFTNTMAHWGYYFD
ncbi:unnamed protein product [Hymenolepis diminuta]|uniref:glutathione transferase n=1 Tax=Hymenolepis diminuta TaxID=6216 RepID=A0A564YG13_HYMDI|nr:unnamed protein product [Hymenolepis diminuta]